MAFGLSKCCTVSVPGYRALPNMETPSFLLRCCFVLINRWSVSWLVEQSLKNCNVLLLHKHCSDVILLVLVSLCEWYVNTYDCEQSTSRDYWHVNRCHVRHTYVYIKYRNLASKWYSKLYVELNFLVLFVSWMVGSMLQAQGFVEFCNQYLVVNHWSFKTFVNASLLLIDNAI